MFIYIYIVDGVIMYVIRIVYICLYIYIYIDI